jgi:hypothetical protein
MSPAWSPDGSAIAFVSEIEQRAGIFVIPALDGAERSIVSSGLTVGGIIQISWSPEGRQSAIRPTERREYRTYSCFAADPEYAAAVTGTRVSRRGGACLLAGRQAACARLHSSSAVYTIYVSVSATCHSESAAFSNMWVVRFGSRCFV